MATRPAETGRDGLAARRGTGERRGGEEEYEETGVEPGFGLWLIRDPFDVDPRGGDRCSQSPGHQVSVCVEEIRDRHRGVRLAVRRQPHGLVDSLRPQIRPPRGPLLDYWDGET